MKLPGVYNEIADERQRQDAMWGEQNHPDGTGDWGKLGIPRRKLADIARWHCEQAFKGGEGTWYHILNEEWCEAIAEDDPLKLRKELTQCAAVIVAWVEAIDRRLANGLRSD